jgi:hypothetical protein
LGLLLPSNLLRKRERIDAWRVETVGLEGDEVVRLR